MTGRDQGSLERIAPWLERPYGLISWLDMLDFSALEFYEIGTEVEMLILISRNFGENDKIEDPKGVHEILKKIDKLCADISLRTSSDLAKRLVQTITGETSTITVGSYIRCLDWVIKSEVKRELFLWISPEKARYYSKTAEELLDKLTLSRFSKSNIEKEAEEAMKSYALNRNTACIHHLMRLIEPGKDALGLALGVTPKQTDRGAVFVEYDKQFNAKPQDRPPIWKTHGDFLVEISGDLKAAEKTWRHHSAHHGKFYDEAEAEYVLKVVPRFIKHLAARLDETGKLYPP